MKLAVTAVVLAIAAPVAAEPLRAVVRHAGGDERPLERLAGQIVDLDVEAVDVDGALEPTLDAQIAAATTLATARDAAAVVWFVTDGAAIVVIVATPGDRRVLVRTIDAGDASATAEAAAQAARTALRALTLGGTIGVALPEDEEPAPVIVASHETPLRWHAGLGWQVAIDRGADAGAHAVWQRVGVTRGRWGVALELGLGPPLDRAGDVDLEVGRSTAVVAIEHRRGPWRFALGAGVALYQRATLDVPAGFTATDRAITAAAVVAPAVRWVFHPGGGAWGVEVAVGVDVVVGAPDFAVERDGAVETVANLATLQPRLAVGVVIGP